MYAYCRFQTRTGKILLTSHTRFIILLIYYYYVYHAMFVLYLIMIICPILIN